MPDVVRVNAPPLLNVEVNTAAEESMVTPLKGGQSEDPTAHEAAKCQVPTRSPPQAVKVQLLFTAASPVVPPLPPPPPWPLPPLPPVPPVFFPEPPPHPAAATQTIKQAKPGNRFTRHPPSYVSRDPTPRRKNPRVTAFTRCARASRRLLTRAGTGVVVWCR